MLRAECTVWHSPHDEDPAVLRALPALTIPQSSKASTRSRRFDELPRDVKTLQFCGTGGYIHNKLLVKTVAASTIH